MNYRELFTWNHSALIYKLDSPGPNALLHLLIVIIYTRNPVMCITKQTTLLQSNTTEVCCNSDYYLHKYAPCFGLYLEHRQTCQYKNHTKEDIIKM